ncbi:RNA polymerase sigma factor [Sedimentisphaera salicampi]|uniref:RNA polymerase sigma factor n=1 Tax=Sedimentisphaera salicampi TaxID=1941349 RepID=A0A1W6LP34_9BACT|nr:sigma-70 family RNA polymerase sigma factor [Sedimentisphaera salicampi]ARN57538.1 Sigma-W factor [Sedimentisphaera salicampi]OXU14400.1 Sigma-W factor [Sedimentisphaera salicampi]
MHDNLKNIDDSRLARFASNGNRAAFDELADRFTGKLLLFVSSKTNNYHDAEDIVQETMIKAYRNIEKFDSKSSFKTWIFTIAYRTLVSNTRKSKPVLMSEESQRNLEITEQSHEDYGWVWQKARKLGEEAFLVLWLKYKQEMSVSEIAKVMGKTNAATRVLLYRSRKKMAKKLYAEQEKRHNSFFRSDEGVSFERAKL